jgi:membrane associated rhomboid family serine protease
MPGSASTKVCVICGEDCLNKPRTKDAKGRYFCKACYERAATAAAAHDRMPVPTPPAANRFRDDPADAGEYDLEPVSQIRASRVTASMPSPSPTPVTDAPQRKSAHALVHTQIDPRASASAPTTGPAICPSCERSQPSGTLVCVPCGINITTGRSIQTAEIGNIERIYEHARGILWFASWILLIGFFPVTSEAHGSCKPWALRSLALATVLITVTMWGFEWTGSSQMHSLKNLLLWSGDAEPDAEHIEMFYYSPYGDHQAFEAKKRELWNIVPRAELSIAAHEALPRSKQCFGEFHVWQLITHAFLHADPLHLLGNLLFMLIFGSRINALIGNVATLLLYPVLAIGSALPQMVAVSNEMPLPSLGASGAIMGLAGMYFILFPVAKVHVALFIRPMILLLGFFRWHGVWLLLLYFGLDVVATVLQSADGVAHWAHMGGFLIGAAIALLLLFTRAVNARGKDMLSVLLGRNAWPLIGRPSQWLTAPEGEGWLTRLRIFPKTH